MRATEHGLSQDDYLGIGTGTTTTDPLVSTLFPGYDYPAQARLWHIGYLFYKAKKEDAMCGGDTTPIYLPLDGGVPVYLPHWVMADVEKLGDQFDFYLRETINRRFTAESDKQLKESMETLAQVMTFTSKKIAELKESLLISF